MDEQIAQLCTLQVGTSNFPNRLKQVHECTANWSGNRLVVQSAEGTHMTTFAISADLLNGHYFWIRLLRSPCYKVRVLLDPKCPVLQISSVRIYAILQYLNQNFSSLNMLLDEDLLENCLQRQAYMIENLDQHQDRALRKQHRLAAERLKEAHQTSDLSDQTTDLAAIFMRFRETSQEPFQPAEVTFATLGLGFGYDWNDKAFVKNPLQTSSKSLPQFKAQADSFSQTERSFLSAWKAAAKDILLTGPIETSFHLPQMLWITVDNDAQLEQWITECTHLGISQAIVETGFLPTASQSVEVLFFRPNVIASIQSAKTSVCNTLSFTLRMQHEGGFTHTLLNQNEDRIRKLQMNTIQRWTTQSALLSDLPLAWCIPGCWLADDRAHEGRSTSLSLGFFGTNTVSSSKRVPQILLRAGQDDFQFEDRFVLSRSFLWTLHLGPPRKWLKNVRFKMCHVSPDVADVRIQQQSSLHSSPTEADALIQSLGHSRMSLRASLPHQLSFSQAQALQTSHFEVCPNLTLAQHSLGQSGTLASRPIDAQCAVCFDDLDRSQGLWWTLCGHVQCADCGPMTFRGWTPNHNAGSVFINCSMCRTPLSSLDVFRFKEGIPNQVPMDSVSQAIQLETSSLARRHDPPEKPLWVHIHAKHDLSPTFLENLPNTIHTLLFSHMEPFLVQQWQPILLEWLSHTRKNIKIVFVGPSQCHTTLAFRKMFEI